MLAEIRNGKYKERRVFVLEYSAFENEPALAIPLTEKHDASDSSHSSRNRLFLQLSFDPMISAGRAIFERDLRLPFQNFAQT
jgi:hypothetical protein